MSFFARHLRSGLKGFGLSLVGLRPKQHECVLAIVGANDVPNYAAESIIRQYILEHKPMMVVTSNDLGVATLATSIATELGLLVTEFQSTVDAWASNETGEISTMPDGSVLHCTVPGGYQTRNTAIAGACTCLVRIVATNSKSRNSEWTRDYAQNLGKQVFNHVIGR